MLKPAPHQGNLQLTSLYRLMLVIIVILGGALRFYRLNWDDGHIIHPDERYIIWVATTIRWPANLNTWEGWQAALDPHRSSFNPFYWPPQAEGYDVKVRQDQPRTFAYGHFPLYLLVILANGLAVLGRQPNWLSYSRFALVGRPLSGLFDLGTIVMTFLLGRRLFGRKVGLLAATFVSFTPLHIQLSHFYAFDTMMTFFVMAGLWLVVRYVQEKHWRDALAAGACAGLAIGSKFTAIWLLPVLVMPLLIEIAQQLCRGGTDNAFKGFFKPASVSAGHLKLLWPLGLMLLAAFVAFGLTSPFALIEGRVFLSNVSTQGAMARGSLDWPYTRQYHATWPYVYSVWQMLQFTLGPALTLAGCSGVIWAVWRAWRQATRLDELVLLVWTTSYFALIGGLYTKFIRYTLPTVPALAIFAAAVLVMIHDTLPQVSEAVKSLLGKTLIAVTLATTALGGWAFARAYAGEHPWITASRWIYTNVPPRETFAVEHWDDHLPLPLEISGQERTQYEYGQRELQPYNDPDSLEKLNTLLTELVASDYVVLTTHRLWGTIPRWPQRYPLTARYYAALFGEQMGYRLEFFAARYPHLGPITFKDQPLADHTLPIPPPLRDFEPSPFVIELGRADESFTVYDHPLVLIFRNVERLSLDQMRERVIGNQ